jgi:hypothetical protein
MFDIVKCEHNICSFIQAQHSRAPLRISRDILEYLLSFYQVPPSFLGSVFPFGARVSANFHDISALRVESRLNEARQGPKIPLLSRSGLDIRICYSLRSVEQSINQVPLPWSIRQTAIYHSFDLITGEALWINVKGNQLLKTRVEESVTIDVPADGSPQSPFAASLSSHMIFAEWAAEGWGSYIDAIECEMQRLTLRTIIDPVIKPSTSVDMHNQIRSGGSIVNVSDSYIGPENPMVSQTRGKDNTNTVENRRKKTRPSGMSPKVDAMAENEVLVLGHANRHQLSTSFSFEDLKRLHHIEETTEEIITVLAFNVSTLEDLKAAYRSAWDAQRMKLPSDSEDMKTFETQLIVIVGDLEVQDIRAKALLKKIQERKTMVRQNSYCKLEDLMS